MAELVEKEKEKEKPKEKKKTVDKWKKKIWYKIYAPAEFEEKEIGETVAEKPQMVMNRVVSASVRDLAGNPTKGQIYMQFKVKDVKGNKAYTDVIGFSTNESYMRRLIRRRMSKIEVVFDTVTNDNMKVRVAGIALTAKKATEKQRAGVYKAMREELEKFCKTKPYEKLISELIFGNVAAKVFNIVKKIVPIKRVEIVKATLLPSK